MHHIILSLSLFRCHYFGMFGKHCFFLLHAPDLFDNIQIFLVGLICFSDKLQICLVGSILFLFDKPRKF